MSINSRMDKQTVVYLYNDILPQNKKNYWRTYSNMDKYRRTVCWLKMPDKITVSIHDSAYEVLEQADLIYADRSLNTNCRRGVEFG